MFILNRYKDIAWIIYTDEKGRVIVEMLDNGNISLVLWCQNKEIYRSFVETNVAALGQLYPALSWDARLAKKILDIMDD
jgi:hypothetical protein